MTMKEQPIESDDVHSERLLRHVQKQIEMGGRVQVSEKARGAFAHALKPIADWRGWKYETHADAHTVALNLSKAEANPRIRELFSIANGLHKNYHVDKIP